MGVLFGGGDPKEEVPGRKAHAGAPRTGGGAQAEVPPAGGCERGLSGGVRASGQAVQVRRIPGRPLE